MGLEPEMILTLVYGHSFFFFFQELLNKIFSEGTVVLPYFVRKIDFAFQNVCYSLGMVLRFEGSIACNEFENGDTKGPKIDFLIIPSS